MKLLRSQYDFGVFRPVQYGALAALKCPRDFVENQKAEYQKRHDALCGGLRRIGWNVPDSHGTMFVWAKLPDGYDDSFEFCTLLMEKAGIITGYHAQINYRLFDYHIKAFINLEVEPYQKKEFYPFIQAIPNVIECNCVTGDYAMLIEVAFQSTVQLDHFINELQHFGRTKTQIVFSTSVEHRDVPIQ